MERLLFEFGIRAALIVLTTAIVLRALRIRIAAVQHAVWVGVLILMLLLPAWLAWGPKAALPLLPARSEPASTVVMTAEDPVLTPPPSEVSEVAIAQSPVWNWNLVFIGLYFAGAFVLLLRLAIGTMRANRLTSASCAAPVTVGVLRPRVILPECWSEWPQAQLDAVLTHERAHARRRDPLFQWLALCNRAVFWFHPLAWWLERKLSALAEEACDAAVLERGHDPREYSQYLLELARAVQRAGTRVNVVAMAMPGSYLPQRVKQIVEGIRAPRISRTRIACAAVACAIPAMVFAAGTLDHVPQALTLPSLPPRPLPQPPVLLAQAPAKTPQAPAQTNPPAKLQREVKFEILSLRPVKPGAGLNFADRPTPNGYRATLTIWQAIMLAYTTDDAVTWGATQLKNAPSWLGDFYDIDARVSQADIRAWQHQGSQQELLRSAMRAALQDRCKLAIHEEPSQAEMFELIVAKGGPHLTPAAPGATLPSGGAKLPSGGVGIAEVPGSRTVWHYYSATMGDLVQFLKIGSNRRSIYDKTGLTGRYDFTLQQISEPARGDDAIDNFPIDRLGLKLRPGKESRPILVIDHIEKPSEN